MHTTIQILSVLLVSSTLIQNILCFHCICLITIIGMADANLCKQLIFVDFLITRAKAGHPWLPKSCFAENSPSDDIIIFIAHKSRAYLVFNTRYDWSVAFLLLFNKVQKMFTFLKWSGSGNAVLYLTISWGKISFSIINTLIGKGRKSWVWSAERIGYEELSTIRTKMFMELFSCSQWLFLWIKSVTTYSTTSIHRVQSIFP